jgi:hypothetical protein
MKVCSMATIQEGLDTDGTPILRLENDRLQVDIAPTAGGKITSLIDKSSGYDFLWRNAALKLERLTPHSEYDPNFYGGIDELIPNDLPEDLYGVQSPDHGELWTTSMDYRVENDGIVLSAHLPLSKLRYTRRITLRPGAPYVDLDYKIDNLSGEVRAFLWKMHAALVIEPGDQILCSARTGQVVDLEWSRRDTLAPFAWPHVGDARADVIPPRDGTMDFFYLYNLETGRMGLHRTDGNLLFEYQFDTAIFPYAWLFASYGGFDGHYVAVLEPCSAMPLSVNAAAKLGQCTVLAPGASIETRVSIYAGAFDGVL